MPAPSLLTLRNTIEVREPGLGADLLDEVERALEHILTNPEASSRR